MTTEKPAIDPYRELFEKSSDAILIIEGDKFVDCNQATVDMLRYENRGEVLRTHPSELSPPTQPDGRDSYEKANEMIAIAFENGSHRFEWDHRRSDGDVFPVEVLLTAVKEEGREVLHVVWRDITDRRRLEENLRHSQKLEAVGKLAGGIAHDFNNLLVAVMGYSDLLTRRLANDPTGLAHVLKIQDAGQRAATLVKQLLAFARKQPHSIGVVDVGEAVSTVVGLISPIVGEETTVTCSAPRAPARIEADKGHVEQAVMNLVTNSHDAMPRGGTLDIITERRRIPEDCPDLTDLKPGAYVEIRVSDTGRGMPPDVMERSFEPFFTTKEMGRGTGLGLSTVFGIATQYGGTASIESEEGVGTTVRVLLPETHKAPRMEDGITISSEPPRGAESILVAEDDPAVYTFVTTILTEAGYRVRATRSGTEALQILLEENHIDLLLSDVIMPGMRGPDVVRELRKKDRCPQVLFISGYSDDTLEDIRHDKETVWFLAKPFSATELLEQVRRALNGSPEGRDGA